MEIKKENIVAAYNSADDNGKKMLQALFPDTKFEAGQAADNRPVTERINTFDDALRELGSGHPLVEEYETITVRCGGLSDDFLAYLKLRIIVHALNEGWELKFTGDEWRYYPWFYLYTEEEIKDIDEGEKQDRRMMSTGDYVTDYAGFAYATSFRTPSTTAAYIGSRLCLKSHDLAVYCGKQFIEIWADYLLRRKDA